MRRGSASGSFPRILVVVCIALGLGPALFACDGSHPPEKNVSAPVASRPATPGGSQHAIYFTSVVKDGVPENKPSDKFGCSDKVYAVLELRGLSKTQHKLEAIWHDPQGRDRERTRYPFRVLRDEERIWVWLKLHHGPEAALVQFVNPSAGMDEFIGDWKLKLVLDGKLLAEKTFKVVC